VKTSARKAATDAGRTIVATASWIALSKVTVAPKTRRRMTGLV
jgi:hypothetical protein